MEHKPSHRIATYRQTGSVDFRTMLAPERVVLLESSSKNEVLQTLVDATIETCDRVRDADAFRQAIFEREKLSSTDVGNGVGVPHVRIPGVSDFVMAVGRSRQGVAYDARDGKPVHLVILIAANDAQSNAFLKVLARLMSKLRHPEFCKKLLEAETPQLVVDMLAEA